MTEVKVHERPLNLKQAAEYTGVSHETIRRAVKAGELRRHVLPGNKRNYYKPSELDEWMWGEEAGDEGLPQGDAR